MKDDLKDVLMRLGLFVFIIAGGLTLLCNIFAEIFNAILWVVSFDFKETGLPFLEETVIKAIVEAIIISIAALLGVSKKNPIITLITIMVGFVVCVVLYFIKQHLLWIMIGLGTLFITYIICLIVINVKSKKKNDNHSKFGGEKNNE